ncbi:serpin family protein [Endozoicomonas sp. YOMI1]|uniref:serpin family protein n=1 Tax=Endozoicomonas sp. YOMI1 TaxID=2828739 RepID=UPI0027D24902|nr:serpin family protein [Endozoicomonas sp. YOMI1]
MDKVSFAILGITDKKSTVVSSASLAPVLGMVLASMEDNAKKELLLGLPPGSLTEELEIEIHQKLGEFSKDHPYDETHKTISAANFVATASSTKDEYLERILPECYQTQTLENGDMNVADATDTFVNEKTKGKIKTLFDGFSEFDRKQVSVVLGNVMEFRGIWETSFSPDKTAPGRFLCADGTRIENVKKMCTTEDFHFANDGEFTAIAKEFRSENGEDLKLVAIAPNETSATAINNLDSGTINHLIGKLDERKTEITLDLPIIEVENSGDTELLEKITHALGTSIKAQDLSRLDPSPSYALRMVQKIKVSVDEQGAHSSIATAATAQSRGGAQDFFNIDCPSYIAIVDSKGNRLLELVIKDGSFLVPDGSPVITAPEGPEDGDLSDDEEHYTFGNTRLTFRKGELVQNVRKNFTEAHRQGKTNKGFPKNDFLPLQNDRLQKDGESSIEDVNTSTLNRLSKNFQDVDDESTLILRGLNLNGEFNISGVELVDDYDLYIIVDTVDTANKVRQKVLKSIGEEEHKQFVQVWKNLKTVKVEVSFKALEALRDTLLSDNK